MNHFASNSSHHQLDLLKVPASEPSVHNNFQLLTQLQSKLPPDHKYTDPSNPAKKLAKKIFGSGIKAIVQPCNGNLLALGYLFLVIGYRDSEMDELKVILIDELDILKQSYKELRNYPNQQSIDQEKFFQLTKYVLTNLNLHKPELGIFQILDNLYVALQIMVLYFRALLHKVKYPSAHLCDHKLKTDDIYAILSEYFDLNCQSNGSTYFFNDYGLFISKIEEDEYIFGRYYENETLYLESEKLIRQSAMDYLSDLNDKMKKSNTDLKLSISGFIFPNEEVPYFNSNLPTPEFGEENMKQSLNKMKQLASQLKLGKKNFSFKSEIIDENEYPQLRRKAGDETSSKTETIKESKTSSLQSMTYKQCDSERDQNKQVVEKKDDQQNPEGIYSPISDNVVHYIGSSKYFNDFLSNPNIEAEVKKEQNPSLLHIVNEKSQLNILSKSCFHETKLKPIKKNQQNQEPASKSAFSCCCSQMKQAKIGLTSKVVDLAYVPSVLSFKKEKKNIESQKYLPTYKKLEIRSFDNLKQKGLQTCRSQERINGFIKGKMPVFLKNRSRKRFKSKESKSTFKQKNKEVKQKYLPKATMMNTQSTPSLKNSKEYLPMSINVQKQIYAGSYYQQPYFTSPTIYHNYYIYPESRGLRKNAGQIMAPEYRKY